MRLSYDSAESQVENHNGILIRAIIFGWKYGASGRVLMTMRLIHIVPVGGAEPSRISDHEMKCPRNASKIGWQSFLLAAAEEICQRALFSLPVHQKSISSSRRLLIRVACWDSEAVANSLLFL